MLSNRFTISIKTLLNAIMTSNINDNNQTNGNHFLSSNLYVFSISPKNKCNLINLSGLYTIDPTHINKKWVKLGSK